jgi:type II secretory pathway pseudopilin PulG
MTKQNVRLQDAKSSGFTIVEMLIATAVSSMVVMLISMALIQIARTYYKGVISSRTQEAARTLIDDIAQTIQFQGQTPMVGTDGANTYKNFPYGAEGDLQVKTYCIGQTRYSYALNMQQQPALTTSPNSNRSKHALVRDDFSGGSCSIVVDVGRHPATNASSSAREMLTTGMRLGRFSITPYSAYPNNILWRIDVQVITGDSSVLEQIDPADVSKGYRCKTAVIGSQFCAVSELSTTVALRQE